MKYIRRRLSIRFSSILIIAPVFSIIMLGCEKPVRVVSVKTDAVIDVGSNTCIVQGTIVDLGEEWINEHGFCYSLSETPTVDDLTKKRGEVNIEETFTDILSGLQANTKYYVRAYVQNEIGEEYYGDILSFTTGLIYTDARDSHEYEWVKIGDQVWMAENLAYLTSVGPYNEGSETDSYYQVYNYYGSSVNEAKFENAFLTYGVLYNWPAALNACPDGWHLPTDAEWKQLEIFLGMSQSDADYSDWRGTSEGEKLKATSGWDNNGGGTDDYGFSALPGGFHGMSGEGFGAEGEASFFRSATEYSSSIAWNRGLNDNGSDVNRDNVNHKGYAFSVRCIRDID